jgi:hypothetical protein
VFPPGFSLCGAVMAHHFPNTGSLSDVYKPGGFFLLAELFPLENVFCRQNKQIKNIR